MTNRKKTYILFFIFFIFVVCGCFFYAYYEARNIIIKEIDYSNKDIPNSFIGKKVIFISDIHLDKYFTHKHLKELIIKINERNPDIILLGGDYTHKEPFYSVPFFEEISKLKSKYGIYTVLGNHDHWEDASLIQNGFLKSGFNICDNGSYWIKEGTDSIKIGGVGDLWEDKQVLENTIYDVVKEDFCILLSHNPDYIKMMDSEKIDLMLSGHTHAGQVTFFGLWAPIMPGTFHPKYETSDKNLRYGWKRKNNIDLYITSGIGMGGFPFRFFARPEIVEITLSR